MTLEAAKEMDKRCVLNWLYEFYIAPSRAFDEHTEEELKMFAHDALVLLKEQEQTSPTWIQGKAYCGRCSQRLPRKSVDRETNYCSYCGQAVKWDG